MKANRLFAVSLTTLLFLGLSFSGVSASSAGQKCSKVGALSDTKQSPLVCTKVGKKLVWKVVATTTIPARVTTTTVAATTTTVAATTSTAAATTTTTAAATTTTTAATTTTTAAAAAGTYITAGAFCAPAGSTGYSKTGTFYTCKTSDTDTRNRWRQ
jgi:hypothetical protein